MPSKAKTNTKAVEARERKENVKQAAKVAKAKADEDALWADEGQDRASQKKKEQEAKRQAELDKRKARQELVASDEASHKAKNFQQQPKVTQSQIAATQERQRAELAAQREAQELAKQKLALPVEPTPNVNRPDTEEETTWVGLEDLEIELKGPDKHPEKRMRAAFNAYEAQNLPILKQENPSLKLSQLKEILWKQWQKAPENPLNQGPE